MRLRLPRFLCGPMLSLMMGFNLVFTAGCDAKPLDQRAARALTALDGVLAVLPPDAPGVTEVKQFRADLGAFRETVKSADTPAKQAAAVIQFATLITNFNATVKPFIPADSPAGVKLAQADKALKSLSAKIACLLAAHPQAKQDNAQVASAYGVIKEFGE